MGLLAGTLSFVRYRVEGPEPDPFWETVDQRIRAFSFREMESGTEEKAMGWVGLHHMLDTEFAYANYAAGDYLTFSFRVDRKTVPGALLKKYLLAEERRIASTSGRSRISRQERGEVRERVRSQLLAKSLPVPAVYDVCWCISRRWLLFTGVSAKIREDFEKYFNNCFELDLVPSFPWDAATMPAEAADRLLALGPELFAR